MRPSRGGAFIQSTDGMNGRRSLFSAVLHPGRARRRLERYSVTILASIFRSAGHECIL